MADRNRPYAAKDGEAAKGDRVVVDFVGRIEGEEFQGGKGEGVEVTLGSGGFIPGFEDQLVGGKAGEERKVTCGSPRTTARRILPARRPSST